MAPKAINAEYLLFQSYEVILVDTKAIIGSITGLPITCETTPRQHPADKATPHSSASSSSSSINILYMLSTSKLIKSVLAYAMYPFM
jgi:hypothetical protein